MEGIVVYAKCAGFLCPPTATWDTAFYLGVPGDRWGLDNVDPNCYPLGAIEIIDTGHVEVQGVILRTWDLAYLDEQGIPIPDLPLNYGDTLSLIERFGMMPATPPQPCDGTIVEYMWMHRTHYSDGEIVFPEGSSCDLATGISGLTGTVTMIVPNPGTDQLRIGPFAGTNKIEVRDPLGRLVHSQSANSGSATIETSAWATGTYYITMVGNSKSQVLNWIKQ